MELIKKESFEIGSVSYAIEVYRLSTPFGGFLHAYLDGRAVPKGPMQSVEDAIELSRRFAMEEFNKENPNAYGPAAEERYREEDESDCPHVTRASNRCGDCGVEMETVDEEEFKERE